jgi:peptidoglycan/LPS O-acetylase OafA/YrhL
VPAAVRLLVGCGAFALALNWLAAAPAILRRALEFAPLRRLGVWSFSLYLWQQPFYQLVRHADLDPALGLALSIATGILAFHTIEQPARQYLNALWSRPVAAPTKPLDDEDDQLQQS